MAAHWSQPVKLANAQPPVQLVASWVIYVKNKILSHTDRRIRLGMERGRRHGRCGIIAGWHRRHLKSVTSDGRWLITAWWSL